MYTVNKCCFFLLDLWCITIYVALWYFLSRLSQELLAEDEMPQFQQLQCDFDGIV